MARRPSLGAAFGGVAFGQNAIGYGADERKAAFDGYLRTGVASRVWSRRGCPKASSTAGGYTVTQRPGAADRPAADAQSSPMREIATIRIIGSGAYAKPVSTAGLVAELGGRDRRTARRPPPPTLDLLSFPAADLYAAPAATQALLDDSQVNLDQWLADEVNDAFAAQETAAFVNGDGASKPKGFLSYTQVADASQAWGTRSATIGTGVSGGFPTTAPADKLLDLIYAPMARFRPNGRFVMNRRTLAAVRKFKDSNGDYVLQPGVRARPVAVDLRLPGHRDRDHAGYRGRNHAHRLRRLRRRLPDRGPGWRAASCAIPTPPSPTCCSTRSSAWAAACRTSTPSSSSS